MLVGRGAVVRAYLPAKSHSMCVGVMHFEMLTEHTLQMHEHELALAL